MQDKAVIYAEVLDTIEHAMTLLDFRVKRHQGELIIEFPDGSLFAVTSRRNDWLVLSNYNESATVTRTDPWHYYGKGKVADDVARLLEDRIDQQLCTLIGDDNLFVIPTTMWAEMSLREDELKNFDYDAHAGELRVMRYSPSGGKNELLDTFSLHPGATRTIMEVAQGLCEA